MVKAKVTQVSDVADRGRHLGRGVCIFKTPPGLPTVLHIIQRVIM